MFIIRTAFWLALVVFLLPSDKESRERLAVAAGNVYQQLSTACDRHPEACEKGTAAWGVFKVQAQTAGRIAFDLAMDKLAPRSDAKATSSERTSAPATVQPAVIDTRPAARVPSTGHQASGHPASGQQGTLRDDDIAPRWRGDQVRGRL